MRGRTQAALGGGGPATVSASIRSAAAAAPSARARGVQCTRTCHSRESMCFSSHLLVAERYVLRAARLPAPALCPVL